MGRQHQDAHLLKPVQYTLLICDAYLGARRYGDDLISLYAAQAASERREPRQLCGALTVRAVVSGTRDLQIAEVPVLSAKTLADRDGRNGH
jgi:hypothetical protein